MNKEPLENLELKLLLEGIRIQYGYDFNHYAKPSLKRRLRLFLAKKELNHFSELLPLILHNKNIIAELILSLSVNVTEMYRTPEFFCDFKEKVIPLLKTYPFIKVWCAGCSTGEEAYSLAILLYESGLLGRTQIYATDFNSQSLQVAAKGIYSVDRVKHYSKKHQQVTQVSSLSDYYHAKYDSVRFKYYLRERITFSQHNLVIDHHFGEMNVVFCRNVLIYFDQQLQNRVLTVLKESLVPRGFLCLGFKESLFNTALSPFFEDFSGNTKIYRLKVGGGHDL